ncbi:hypothetical protein H4R18_005285 [Coemansia javaensis]|uniref:Uncharacterized protein n=1 Tax=Coemansia javaensis TaxID=2761396 RepID=A0A9W8LEJ3_9FUNG|nr:hypothetical protein H4R18_005285 [Coemansia javaensis]
MAARYSKVLTLQNAQMFFGGALLAGTLGYAWQQSRTRGGAELERRLRSVHQNMYWSMPLAQRPAPALGDGAAAGCRRQRWLQRADDGIGRWWNAKLAGLGSWAARPGYLTEQAARAQGAARQGAVAGWRQAKAAAARGGRWVADRARSAVRWDAAAARLDSLWLEESARWQHAHACAVRAVHPRYARDRAADPREH